MIATISAVTADRASNALGISNDTNRPFSTSGTTTTTAKPRETLNCGNVPRHPILSWSTALANRIRIVIESAAITPHCLRKGRHGRQRKQCSPKKRDRQCDASTKVPFLSVKYSTESHAR